MLFNDAGSIPTVNIFITCLGVVNLMGKLFSQAQTKPATSRQMHREIPLKQQLSNPPTHPKKLTPAPTFPRIGGKPDKPTQPSSDPGSPPV